MKGTAYLIQGTLISLWWIGLLISNSFYQAFQFPGIPEIAFNSFLLPDVLVIGFLSIIRAYSKQKNLEYVILGGFSFATLYCANATILTNGGYLATTLMVLGLAYNLFLINQDRIFRKSNTKNIVVNGLKTILQIFCVWTITLLVFPILILESFGQSPILLSKYKVIALFLFALFSVLGIYSAIFMVKIGEGTPLPIDQTQKLVTDGPYKYVRNPMAIAGIGQGLSISIMYMSVHILAYTFIGFVLWQFVVRPIEEKNMQQRFGEAYDLYKTKVRCWFPMMRL